jgi:hypothetical protein
MQEEQIREALNCTRARRRPAMQMRNTIFTMTKLSATLPSQASASSGEAIYRPCEVIILANRQVLSSDEFSETVISVSRNTHSPSRGGQHTLRALWS